MLANAQFVGEPRRRRFASPFSTLVAALTVAILVAGSFTVRSLVETKAVAPILPMVTVVPKTVDESVKPPASVSQRPARMRLLGVVAAGTNGKSGLAVIDVEDQGLKAIRVGEQLTANAILVEVGSFYVVVEEDGNRRAFEVERAPAHAAQQTTQQGRGNTAERTRASAIVQGPDSSGRSSQVPQRWEGAIGFPGPIIGPGAASSLSPDLLKAMRAVAGSAKPAEPPASQPGVLAPPLQ